MFLLFCFELFWHWYPSFYFDKFYNCDLNICKLRPLLGILLNYWRKVAHIDSTLSDLSGINFFKEKNRCGSPPSWPAIASSLHSHGGVLLSFSVNEFPTCQIEGGSYEQFSINNLTESLTKVSKTRITNSQNTGKKFIKLETGVSISKSTKFPLKFI